MEYIKINDDVCIEYDIATMVARIFSQSQITKEKEEIEKRLLEMPSAPSDADLLSWARANYPMVNYEVQRSNLQSKDEIISQRLESTAGLKKISEIIGDIKL